MGGQLVKQVYAGCFFALQRGEPLTPNERQVLLYMATVAHDTDAPPRYWGGREALVVHALGRAIPDDVQGRRSVFESVRKALAGVARREAIRLTGAAHPGRRQEYELTVENLFPAEFRTQRQVGPLTTPRWAIDNATLQLAHPPGGPKDQEHQDQDDTTTHPRRAAHLRLVENPSQQRESYE